MPTYTLGDILEKRRLSVGMTLEEAADITNIRPRMLETFEASDYEHFPTKGYAQGMLSSYARTLGLNSHEILALYEKEFMSFSQLQEIAKNADFARRGVSKFGTKKVQSAKPMARRASAQTGNQDEEPQVNATSMEDFVGDTPIDDSSLNMRNVRVVSKRNSSSRSGSRFESRNALRASSRDALVDDARDDLRPGQRDDIRISSRLDQSSDIRDRSDYRSKPERLTLRKSGVRDDNFAGKNDYERQKSDRPKSERQINAGGLDDEFVPVDFSRPSTRNKSKRRRTATLSADPYQSLNEKKAQEAAAAAEGLTTAGTVNTTEVSGAAGITKASGVKSSAAVSGSKSVSINTGVKSASGSDTRSSTRSSLKSMLEDNKKDDRTKKNSKRDSDKEKGNTLSNAMEANVEEFSAEQNRAARKRLRRQADEEERERRSALSRQQNFFQMIAGIIVSIFSEKRTRLIAIAAIMLVLAISIAAVFLITTAGNQNAGVISPQGEQSQNDVIGTTDESNARATVTTTNGSPIAVSISVAEGNTSLINVTYDDDKAYSGTAVGAWSRTFQVTESMEATFGNPDAVKVTENGQEVQITRQEDGTGKLSLVVQSINAAQTR